MFIAYRRSIRLLLPLALVLPLAFGLARDALSQETMAQAMANAITRMMESMGFTNAGAGISAGSVPGMGADPMGMTGWPSAFGPWSGMSGPGSQSMPVPGSAQWSQMADPVSQGMPTPGRGVARSWGASALEGVWEGNQGGLLIVQGGLYRIYSPCQGSINGDIRVGTDRVELTNRRENFTQTFEFALDQGRLALRAQSGQILLYRRLVLNQVNQSSR